MNIRIVSKLTFLMLFLLGGALAYGQQESLFEKEVFTQKGDSLPYRILYPKGFSAKKNYPLILFLHGAGERGNDNEKQLVHGSSLFLQDAVREQFPAIVIMPQCPEADYWASVNIDRSHYPIGLDFHYENGPTKALGLASALLDSFLEKSFVKKDQVYIMGLSMGGMGTYEMLFRRHHTFAAAVAICGGGMPETAVGYAQKVPMWIFTGAQDNVVNPQESVKMVSKILQYGGHPRFTLYDFANHNSWDSAFAEPQLLQWLFSHTKM